MKIKSIIYLTLFILTGIVPANAWNWDFNSSQYQQYMPATFVLLDDKGNNLGSPDIEIVAYNGTDIRGVQEATWDAADKQYVYYIKVYANIGENIEVTFKPYYKATGEPLLLNNEAVETTPVKVDPADVIGDVNAPSQIQPGANPTLQAIRVVEDVQTYEAASNEKTFKLATYPSNLSGFTVHYEQNGKRVETPQNAGSYDVIISRTEGGTYQAYNRTLPGALVIGLSTPTVTWPTGLNAQEGSLLSTVLLGTVTDGAFSWSSPESVFNGGGTYMMEAVFTPNELSKYHVVKKHLEVQVTATSRTNITITANDVQRFDFDNSKKTFTFTSTPSSLSGFTVSYKKKGVTAEPINAGTYDVTISRQQDNTYKAFSKTYKNGLVIAQGTPTPTWPTSVILDHGEKLSDAVMTGQSGAGVFSWENGTMTPSGSNTFYAYLKFTPTNTNYKSITSQVAVTVKELTAITIIDTPQPFLYDGNGKAFVVTSTPTLTTGFTISYLQKGTAVTTPTDAGSYDVTISRLSDDTYKAFTQMVYGGLVITQGTLTPTWPTLVILDSGKPLSDAVMTGQTGEGVFSWEKGDTIPLAGVTSFKANLTFTPTDNNYKSITDSVMVKVLTAITIIDTPQSFPYDGNGKVFVVTSEPTSITNFTISYSQNGTAVTTPTDAGSYDVTISRPSDDTYKAFTQTVHGGLVISQIAYPEKEVALISWPQNLSLFAGISLANLPLQSPTNGRFTWANPSLSFSQGKQEAEIIFTPANKNYKIVIAKVVITVFEAPVSQSYQILINQSEGGTFSVKKGGENISNMTYVDENTLLTLQAVPDKGYKFSHYWVNGQQSVSDEVIVTSNVILGAVFELIASTAIEQDEMGLRYYSESGVLFVSAPVVLNLQIVALSGRIVYEKTINGQEQINKLPKGVYLLVFTDASGKKSVKRILL